MKILLHLPHVSLDVPNYFYKGLIIPRPLFRKYNLEMSDLGVDYLLKDLSGTRIKPPYSRLFCDVERFRDDKKERMSQYGEGLLYTKMYDGILFHKHDEIYRKKVLAYYDTYHQKLDEITKGLLSFDDELLILDCHSFSDKMAAYFFKPPFPDICIGIEKDFFDQEILHRIIEEIKKRGYTYQINYPYQGSLVPNCIYNKKVIYKKVVSIMLEINKRIYL